VRATDVVDLALTKLRAAPKGPLFVFPSTDNR